VDALLEHGCSVLDTSGFGGGFVDLIVKYQKKLYLIEIKNPKTKGKLNKLQQKFFEEWKDANPVVVYSTEEALEALARL
jgi:Holliday junction resolvase